MEQVDKLRVLSIEYNTIKDSKAFQEVNEIRNNFVHNKSSSYYGMNIERHKEGDDLLCTKLFKPQRQRTFNQKNLSCNMRINHELPAVVCGC